MAPAKLLSIVIPSFNDAPIVRPFHEAIVAELGKQGRWNWEIIYVDDGSSDNSPEILTEIAASDRRITALLLLHNFGQQRALFAGLDHARGDVVVIIDGDYQYEPSTILRLADAIGAGTDMASGIRENRRDPRSDRLFSAMGNRLLNLILEMQISDYGSAKAFSKELVGRIRRMRHHFSDVLPAALSLRPRIAEVVVTHRPRPSGKSHWNLWMRILLLLDTYVLYGHSRLNSGLKLGALLMLVAPALAVVGLVGPGPWFVWFGAAIYTGTVACVLIAWSILMRLVMRLYRQNVSSEPYIVRARIGGAPPTDPA